MTQYNNNYNNQGGYPPQNNGGYDQGGQQGGQQQRTNSGFDNHAKIQVIGRIVKDPSSEQKGTGKVASAKIAINHRNDKDGTDFWFIEVWGNEGSDSKHNFLVNHCPKGRKVFIEGTPTLRQSEKNGVYSYFPTIKITEIIGLDGGKDNQQGGNGQGGNNQAYNQPPSGQYNSAPQGNYPPAAAPQNNYPPAAPQGGYPPAPNQGGYPPANQGQSAGYPPAPNQQGGYPPAPPAPNPPGAFPPNVPGGGYGAPVPQGVAPGQPNANGGFPPIPPQ